MVAGTPNVDYPAADTGLSVMQIGQDEARTSRVRRASEPYLPRDLSSAPLFLLPAQQSCALGEQPGPGNKTAGVAG